VSPASLTGTAISEILRERGLAGKSAQITVEKAGHRLLRVQTLQRVEQLEVVVLLTGFRTDNGPGERYGMGAPSPLIVVFASASADCDTRMSGSIPLGAIARPEGT
jgi:hypothetical protein